MLKSFLLIIYEESSNEKGTECDIQTVVLIRDDDSFLLTKKRISFSFVAQKFVMETEATEAVRQAENLQNIVNQQRKLLETRPRNTIGKRHFVFGYEKKRT